MRGMDHQGLMQAMRHFQPGGIASFSYGWTTLRGDIAGGLVASALIVPAALSFGELAGLGPVAGLYGALAIGIFGALAGNTRGIISGVNSNVSIGMALVVSEQTPTGAEPVLYSIRDSSDNCSGSAPSQSGPPQIAAPTQLQLDRSMPACDGDPCTDAFNSARCSASSAGGTTSLLRNQPFGTTLSEGLGPLAYGVGIALQGPAHRRRRPPAAKSRAIAPVPEVSALGTSVAVPQPRPCATSPGTLPSSACPTTPSACPANYLNRLQFYPPLVRVSPWFRFRDGSHQSCASIKGTSEQLSNGGLCW